MRLPAASLALLLVLPLWLSLAFVFAGFLGVGYVLIGAGLLQLAIALLSSKRPPRWHVIQEDTIGRYDRHGRLRLTRESWRRQVRWQATQRRIERAT